MPHPFFRLLPGLGLALGLLLAALAGPAARAQTPLGQPSLDEAKVQIWCATARYVYADLGHPRLQSTLRCESGSLPALAASLRPDSLRIYSLLYAPIEERGRIYQGLQDNHARLAALVRAIVGKLRASPARQRSPARLAGLHELEKKLTDYVETGLPPATVAAAPQAETETSLSGPAEAAEATAATAPAASAGPGGPRATAPVALLDRLLAPLALTFSLLSLVLYVLLRLSLGRTLRQLRRAATQAGRGPAELSAAQRQQVEELVARRVAEALRTTGPAAP
ncbi:hypothetical protein HHL22_10765 [Hymenobacter sp. RP-2-7]|uniref:DUF4129 domain-containing protein n=1 Tax=Hymenobacter polaris TaxID=2682546 RepID=A0A7Y0FMN0_9BACT|nr:hypothetical protein [Hymenobacter polaris]NML65686.1 hypothetical protein [Hymenobacter polaris]